MTIIKLDTERKIDNISYLNNTLTEIKNVIIGGKNIELKPGINSVNLEEHFIDNLISNTWRWLQKVDKKENEEVNNDNILTDLSDDEINDIIENENINNNDEIINNVNTNDELLEQYGVGVEKELDKIVENEVKEEVKEVKQVKNTKKKKK